MPTTSTGTESDAHDPATYSEPTPSEDDIVQVEQPEEEQEGHVSPEPEPRQQQKQTKPGEPAYVAPIPKIGPISPITPVSPPAAAAGISVSPTNRPPLPKFVGSYLVGKVVDESGDIVDDKTGQVLARAGGDLPSIVGRTVSNNKGDILGDDGELLGYVEDLNIEKKPIPGTGSSPRFPPMRTLAEMMGRANASLMVDHLGNILDTNGNVVGKFHDNNNPAHRKEREEQELAKQAAERTPAFQAAAESAAKAAAQEERKKPEPASASSSQPEPPTSAEGEPEPEPERKYQRRSEDERRQNAQAWRKEAPGESPSDIFLDVKSTTEGIQLTIRIPTVFGNGQQVRPNISLS